MSRKGNRVNVKNINNSKSKMIALWYQSINIARNVCMAKELHKTLRT